MIGPPPRHVLANTTLLPTSLAPVPKATMLQLSRAEWCGVVRLWYQSSPTAKIQRAIEHTTPPAGGRSPQMQSRQTTLCDADAIATVPFEPVAESAGANLSSLPPTIFGPTPPAAINQSQSIPSSNNLPAHSNDTIAPPNNAIDAPPPNNSEEGSAPPPTKSKTSSTKSARSTVDSTEQSTAKSVTNLLPNKEPKPQNNQEPN
mmetsp:Transcript_23553/g.51014  ORF Transcript_23553/g.51014 Transcript_23553/m.51014 type:complete len:203 (-) Transcript_23553:417-1025(-)|eukprot:CAMPEP_0172312866 /NCGR_PEP_ID=MMETSP1058-20130122/18702_1 /TAXON_ID=83371 /ORGANISM="Detonula confervacea, Strain CCMP 353" /LENGTH=202 /DNA_ID=CAMNT_0013026421 /DNA_START=332 /DNA_END=940 /DNA_ORIENTATION=+